MNDDQSNAGSPRWLKPGWLANEFHSSAVDVATWPEWMRRESGFTDINLNEDQRREAAAILRARADQLFPLPSPPSESLSFHELAEETMLKIDCTYAFVDQVRHIENALKKVYDSIRKDNRHR